jgi:hypothetical protein
LFDGVTSTNLVMYRGGRRTGVLGEGLLLALLAGVALIAATRGCSSGDAVVGGGEKT